MGSPAMLCGPFPSSISVPLAPKKVPLVRVKSPVNSMVREPLLSVPPKPLSVRLVALTEPVSVAVPLVLVIEMVPVVVNPAILCGLAGPVMMMSELPALNVPLLVKWPLSVMG